MNHNVRYSSPGPQPVRHHVLRCPNVRRLFALPAPELSRPRCPRDRVGYPACVYGFFMYLAITVMSALLVSDRRAPLM